MHVRRAGFERVDRSSRKATPQTRPAAADAGRHGCFRRLADNFRRSVGRSVFLLPHVGVYLRPVPNEFLHFDCASTMADSAARIAEIRAALNSTGKSIKAYSKRCATPQSAPGRAASRSAPDSLHRFAAGEAPEQQNEHGAHLADASSVREDEIKELLANLTALSKVRPDRLAGAVCPACRSNSSRRVFVCSPVAVQDLHGRCVGRNADDVDVIHDGVRFCTSK